MNRLAINCATLGMLVVFTSIASAQPGGGPGGPPCGLCMVYDGDTSCEAEKGENEWSATDTFCYNNGACNGQTAPYVCAEAGNYYEKTFVSSVDWHRSRKKAKSAETEGYEVVDCETNDFVCMIKRKCKQPCKNYTTFPYWRCQTDHLSSEFLIVQDWVLDLGETCSIFD